MFDLFYCIRDQHDATLVVLAALVCIITSATAIFMLRQALQSVASARRIWLAGGGAATGFGIWSTHFIAMLGYDPGVVAGYRPLLTLASLGIVFVATITAYALAIAFRTPRMIALAASVAGAGFSAMHYVGMAALELPARIIWDPFYVALSLSMAVVPMNLAFRKAVLAQGWTSGIIAVVSMVAAIVGLHFSGMTAMHLIPEPLEGQGLVLSPATMSASLFVTSIMVLCLCLAGGLAARRTRRIIAQSRQQFSILVQNISDCAIYMLDEEGRIANWNAGAQRLKGYGQEDVVGQHVAIFYTNEDVLAGRHQNALDTARLAGKYVSEGWRVRRDGSRFWAHVTIERVVDDMGRFLGFAKITRDMTKFKEDQIQLENATGQLDAALEHMHQGLCLFDADENLILRNRRFVDMWQLKPEACNPGASLEHVMHIALQSRAEGQSLSEFLSRIRTNFRYAMENLGHEPIIWELNETFCVSVTCRAMPEGGWVMTFEDMTERRRSEARIAHLAHHDVLTGLPNRASFNRWIEKETQTALARGAQVALVAIDLDRFKEINDTQGHAAGDRVLAAFAESLAGAIREGEIAARLGGDEFAVARRFGAETDLADFISRLEQAVAQFSASPDVAFSGASMGVAVLPGDAESAEVLLNNADLAMYRAKASLGETLCFYQAGMDEQARNRRQLSNDLRHAIEHNELTVLYQEQRSVRGGVLNGYEALLRWNHPVHGAISPADFIPIAEENGEILKIGEWVLRCACLEAAKWPKTFKLAVNLSPVQLLKADLPELVADILVESGLSARQLELEITETAIIADKVRALHSLRRIKALGVSVAIDDFGTGYSSLDTLHSFPFDKIKIDKSFLLQAEESEQARAIVKAVLSLGRSLSIPVLAEGVETEKQLALLVAEGCEEAQGFYFGRPAPAPSSVPAGDKGNGWRIGRAA